MTFSRGEIWVIRERGELTEKARPALLIQAEALEDLKTLQFCLIYSADDAQRDVFFRIGVEPSEANGLRGLSTIAADKIVTIQRDHVGGRCGVLEEDLMALVNEALIAFQGLG